MKVDTPLEALLNSYVLIHTPEGPKLRWLSEAETWGPGLFSELFPKLSPDTPAIVKLFDRSVKAYDDLLHQRAPNPYRAAQNHTPPFTPSEYGEWLAADPQALHYLERAYLEAFLVKPTPDIPSLFTRAYTQRLFFVVRSLILRFETQI
ncbi:MAG: hypothetical protein KM310_00290 [Clostridiales bacterium]|nr:hypothetical protein [Clostridiales bacterium]